MTEILTFLAAVSVAFIVFIAVKLYTGGK